KASDFDSTFQRGFIRITDPIFFRQDFRFRFRNLATTAGDFDHWHVDYVYLDKNVSRDDTLFDDVAFAYVPTPLLTRYSAMPYNQYNANEMTTGMRTWIRNNGGITSSLSYDHNVYQVNSGTLTAVGTYTGGADNLLPFHTGGYSQDPNHNGFSPKTQYTLAVPTTDSADYLVKH